VAQVFVSISSKMAQVNISIYIRRGRNHEICRTADMGEGASEIIISIQGKDLPDELSEAEQAELEIAK